MRPITRVPVYRHQGYYHTPWHYGSPAPRYDHHW